MTSAETGLAAGVSATAEAGPSAQPGAGAETEPAAEAGPSEEARASGDDRGGDTGTGWRAPQGKATTTLLLRHGQTPLSAERRFAGRSDAPLTDTGRKQAAAAAARLAVRGGVDVVVSSPLSRARRTAEAVAEATGAGMVIDDDLVETDFGAWEGLTFAEVMAGWPGEMATWMESADMAPPGGESLADAARRALAALDRMLASYPHLTLVVVSHVTPIKTIICRALLAPPAALFRIHLDVASLSEAQFFADGPALVRSLNDTAHLRADGARARTRRSRR